MREIILTINGEEHRLSVDARTTLLDLLRDGLRLTGVKKGCARGSCGACTILVDDRSTLSCLTLAACADGRRIETVEGLARDGELHPVQQAFIDQDAFQCGYCTPGQIMSVIGLLREGETLTDARIRDLMSGNLCRCGAYVNIHAAIRQVTSIEGPEPAGGGDAQIRRAAGDE
jgi:xanthine dehydrogenase YagT iron-sulfur-binding subunit